jgi:polysaccharide biosynthesis transport protein
VDLRELFSVVWKHRYLVALVVVLCAVLGAVFAFTRQEKYESTAKISITPDVESQGFVPSENLSTALATYAETAESGTVRGEAEEILNRPLDAEVDASTEEGTGILEISTRADSATEARDATDAVTDSFMEGIEDDQFVNAEIIEPAETPDAAVQPRPPLIIATSIAVGLGMAVLLAIALDRFRRRIETPEDLAEVTNLPLLAQIPRKPALARDGNPSRIWNDPDMADVQEAFRSFRTHFAFLAEGKPPAIHITSASVGAGKTTTVANVGVAFAQMGVKTALVDADLRRPALHRLFGVDGPSWVQNPEPADPTAGRETAFPNLYVLPAGPPVSDPAAVLHLMFARTLENLRRSFAVILIDSPPVLGVSDALITARWADGVVLVVAARQDKPSSVEHAIDELQIAQAKIKGVVLNQAVVGGYDYYRPASLDGEGADGDAVPAKTGPARDAF